MRHLRRWFWLPCLLMLVALLGALGGCGAGGCGDGEPANGGGLAFVTLDASPRAAVTLDGELIGNTPLRKYAVDPGEHTVLLECVACPVAQSETLEFSVEPREIYTHDSTTFDMGTAEATTPTATAGGTGDGATAYLTVNSKPWSVVFLDGALLGNTPLLDRPIDAGYHTMVLKCGPCDPNAEIERTFFVEEGQTHVSAANSFGVPGSEDPLATALPADDDTEGEPEGEGYLRIQSVPWAKVTVDGISLGRTPLASFTVEAGSHKALLECGECTDPQNELFLFSVAPGETYSIEAVFEN